MAESFQRNLSEVDARSAQFTQRGVQGVNPLEDVAKQAPAVLASAAKQKKDETQTAFASEFSTQRTALAEDKQSSDLELDDLMRTIAITSSQGDVKTANNLKQQLETLSRDRSAAFATRRRALMSKFVSNYPAMADDFKKMEQLITGGTTGLTKAIQTTQAQAREDAFKEIEKKAVASNVSFTEQVDRQATAGKLKATEDANNLRIAQNIATLGEAEVQASSVAHNYYTQAVGEINEHLTRGFFQVDGVTYKVESFLDEDGQRINGFTPEALAILKADLLAKYNISEGRTNFRTAISGIYSGENQNGLMKTADDQFSSQLDLLLSGRDLGTTITKLNSIKQSEALFNSIRDYPTWLQDLALTDKALATEIHTKILPNAQQLYISHGKSLDAMRNTHTLAVKNGNGPLAKDLGIALAIMGGENYYSSVVGHVQQVATTGEGTLPSGNAALDRATAPVLASTAQTYATSKHPKATSLAQVSVNELLDVGYAGNIQPMKELITPDSTKAFQANSDLWQGTKLRVERGVMSSEDYILDEMADEGLVFGFQSPLQASTTQVSKIRGKVVTPTDAFTVSASGRRFTSPESKKFLDKLNHSYLILRNVEGKREADEWASSYLEGLNKTSVTHRNDKAKSEYLDLLKRDTLLTRGAEKAIIQRKMEEITSQFPEVVEEAKNFSAQQLRKAERDSVISEYARVNSKIKAYENSPYPAPHILAGLRQDREQLVQEMAGFEAQSNEQ